MKVVIAGASGFIGSHLVPYLRGKGHKVIRLVRSHIPSDDTAFWDPEKGVIDEDALQSADAVINLSGENVADGRWSAEKKRRILSSRISSTLLLANTLAKMQHPPKVFINSSAIGIYGNKWDEVVDEDSFPGVGFLADVCREWEKAAENAEASGIRVVLLRTGIVLAEDGGVLAKMLFPFKWGFGGKLGQGQQYMSWIDMDDMLEVFNFILTNESIRGKVNAVSPNPVKNEEFTEYLGAVLGRPTFFKVPETVIRLAFGEMADEMFLSSTRALPKRLMEAGFVFRYPSLHDSLSHILT